MTTETFGWDSVGINCSGGGGNATEIGLVG